MSGTIYDLTELLRKHVKEVLDRVEFKRETVFVRRHTKVIAKICPVSSDEARVISDMYQEMVEGSDVSKRSKSPTPVSGNVNS